MLHPDPEKGSFNVSMNNRTSCGTGLALELMSRNGFALELATLEIGHLVRKYQSGDKEMELLA